jgi:enamine deaminase RidA (YjgF/YER057c/UK114 family)
VAEIALLNPAALGAPLGPYSHIARVRAAGELVFIAGQVGSAAADFDGQCGEAFANVRAALDAVGAGWGNVAQFTTYLVHSQDIPRFMAWRRREFPQMFPGGAYPPNTLLIVDRLVEERFLIEIQAVAAL